MSSVTPPRMGMVMNIHGGIDDQGPPDGADSFDALRDLFLGGGGSAEEYQPREESAETHRASEPELEVRSHPFVEALILGHLPVQQSPWVMQYARDAAAQRRGPVALLRIREGEATLDLVGGTGEVETRASATLEDALTSIAAIAQGLIVRVDAATEPVLPGLACVDALTLLTGADEAAVVGSYRTIKTLLGAVDDRSPRLRLAIMGSTPEKAMPAAEKIQKAVAAHLQQEIAVSACLARIASGRSSLLFRGLVTDDVGVVLEQAREILSRRADTKAPPRPAPRAVEAGEPPPAAVVSRLGHASPTVVPSSSISPSVPAKPAAPQALSSHLTDLSTTPVISPLHPGVEFALDRSGGLNLLIHAKASADVGPALSTLLSAGAWTRVHSPLITQALPGMTVDPSKPPTLHLFTGSAKGCRGVVEAGIRLHLLARVEVEGRSGWFCTEIS
jgi:hypothetical protein